MTNLQLMKSIMTKSEKDIFMEGYSDALMGREMNPERQHNLSYKKGYDSKERAEITPGQ